MVCSSFSLERLNVPNAPISVTPYYPGRKSNTDETKNLIWDNPYCAEDGHLKKKGKNEREDRTPDHSGEIVTRTLKAMSAPNLNSSTPINRMEQTHLIDLTKEETTSLKSKSQSTFKRTFSGQVKGGDLWKIVNDVEKDFFDDRNFFLESQYEQFLLNNRAFIQNTQKPREEENSFINQVL